MNHYRKKQAEQVEPAPIRKGYEELGVDNYYLEHGSDYRNPHEKIIHKLIGAAIDKSFVGETVLDLCCGSGEVTLMLGDRAVTGVDPFTGAAYLKRTGRALLPLTFQDICVGALTGSYDTVICSFALHLCPQSLLPMLLWQLGQISDTLIVITPNKKPNCDAISNWIMVEEIMENRVRMHIYRR